MNFAKYFSLCLFLCNSSDLLSSIPQVYNCANVYVVRRASPINSNLRQKNGCINSCFAIHRVCRKDWFLLLKRLFVLVI